MKKKKRNNIFRGVPVWLQAFLLALVALLLLFVVAAVLGMFPVLTDNYAEQAGYVLHAVFIAAGCFYICRRHPKSVWYVPLLANVFVFLSALIEPAFWTTSLWIFLGSAVVLSIPAAMWGRQRA